MLFSSLIGIYAYSLLGDLLKDNDVVKSEPSPLNATHINLHVMIADGYDISIAKSFGNYTVKAADWKAYTDYQLQLVSNYISNAKDWSDSAHDQLELDGNDSSIQDAIVDSVVATSDGASCQKDTRGGNESVDDAQIVIRKRKFENDCGKFCIGRGGCEIGCKKCHAYAIGPFVIRNCG